MSLHVPLKKISHTFIRHKDVLPRLTYEEGRMKSFECLEYKTINDEYSFWDKHNNLVSFVFNEQCIKKPIGIYEIQQE